VDAAIIGNRIRLAREQKGISQEELAALISKRQYAVSEYEAGKRRIFANDLPAIADALEVPVAFFFEDTPVDEEEELLSEFRRLPNKETRSFAVQFLHDLRHLSDKLK